MIALKDAPRTSELKTEIDSVFSLAGEKTRRLAERWKNEKGAPVFTVKGKYGLRGWTEWTQGFQFGNALLVFEALGDPWFLEYGRSRTVEAMAPHVSHMGVHDH